MPTQLEIGRHLDLATRRVRELRDTGVLPDGRTSTLDAIRTAYLRHLRERARARSRDGVASLAEERARLADVQRHGQDLKNEDLQAELLRRADVLTTWAAQTARARTRVRRIAVDAVREVPGFRATMARPLLQLLDEALKPLLSGDGLPRPRSRRRHRGSQ